MRKNKVVLYFVVLSLIWGASFIVIRHIVEVLPPIFAAAVRLAFASLSLALICLYRGESLLISRQAMARIWPLGFIMIGLPFAFLFWGEQFIAPGLAGLLNGTVPLWTALFQVAISSLRAKRLERELVVGLILGFLGIIFVFANDLTLPLKDQELLGGLAILAMAVCYAIGNVLSHKVLTSQNHIPLFTMTLHQHLVSALFIGLISFTVEPLVSTETLANNLDAILYLVYLGLVPSAIGFYLYFQLIKGIGSVKAGAIAYLLPVTALLFDFLFFGSIPPWNAFVGAGFILVGLRFIRTKA